ncbi:alpha/beta fold hydrolase [Azospirillum agricola]|uniref:alpha/beta fold hydrolase n=1 Tax=Azospirillum agricola TaxID=1720247 RepID=UPI000A0EF16B|nr:alpha/beta hydrolase [Azospirillum agricola]SMH46727.1 Pimeloyl-ACP methyl ester carboxylesterase [Azospirillum lipoferum]
MDRQGWIVVEDGARLHHVERVTGAPDAPLGAAAGPVILLHSLFFSGAMFDDLLDRLPAGLRCVRPDHRGQGRSETGRHAPSIERLADDTIALIKALGGGPAHLVGSSMGGYVALAVLRRRPELVASAVLSCCTSQPEIQVERFAALENALRSKGAAALVDAIAATMFGSRFIADDGEGLQRWRAAFAEVDDRIADAVHGVAGRTSFVESLSAIQAPLQLVSGALDAAKRPEDMQFIADRVPGSRHVTLEQSGHTPPVEDPDAFAAILRRFWTDIGLVPAA